MGEAVLDQQGSLVDSQAHTVANEHQGLAFDLAPPVSPRRARRLGRGSLPELPALRPGGFLASFLLSHCSCGILGRRQIASPLARFAVLTAPWSAAASSWLFLCPRFGRWCRLVLHAEPAFLHAVPPDGSHRRGGFYSSVSAILRLTSSNSFSKRSSSC